MEKDKFTVWFASNFDISPMPRSIVIVPTTDRWNNFGHRTNTKLRITTLEPDTAFFDGHIGFLPDPSSPKNDVSSLGIDKIRRLLSEAGGQILPADNTSTYFTMLADLEQYRLLVQRLNPNEAVSALVAMNDVVEAGQRTSPPSWLDAATASGPFQYSFMRTSEAYFGYRNAASVLKGLQFEGGDELSSSINVRFRLDGRESDHDLEFRFDHSSELPKRIAVVIGRNGVGKSQTLSRIVKAALAGDHDTLTDKKTGGRVAINRVLAFAPTTELSSVFPKSRLKHPYASYRSFSLTRAKVARRTGLNDLILQIARSPQYVSRAHRWRVFVEAIGALDRWDQIALPTRGKNSQALYIHQLIDNSEQAQLERFARIDIAKDPVRWISGRPHPLSSGEMSFLRFAAQASLYVENGSLLLFDEPETHLHPYFISQFVALLDRLLDLTNSSAIIATHSVYFVREVFEDQVLVLRTNKNEEVIAERPRLKTFGADVGVISYFVFDQDDPSRLAQSVEQEIVRTFPDWETVYERYGSKLSIDLLGTIRDAMEDSDGGLEI